MQRTYPLGTRFDPVWFGDASKVNELLQQLGEEFGVEATIDRRDFNAWLTEYTNFTLPVDVAQLARDLIGRQIITVESSGSITRYKLTNTVILPNVATETEDGVGSQGLDSVNSIPTMKELVDNPEILRRILRALLDAYDERSNKSGSSVGLAKVALGSLGNLRIHHKEPNHLADLLIRRGFLSRHGVQGDYPGRIEILRSNMIKFLETGVIPWASQADKIQRTTPRREKMTVVQECDESGLRVIIKVGGDHTTRIPKLASKMIHTLLAEAGLTRGTFNFQSTGNWTGHPRNGCILFAKVMPCNGPSVTVGLKSGQDPEKHTLLGHLAGSWGMKFDDVRRKLEAAAQRLNASNWPSIFTQPTRTTGMTTSVMTQATTPPPPPAASAVATTVNQSPAPSTDETAELESLMRQLIQKADTNGCLTTGSTSEVMRTAYPEREARGLFASLFSTLRARGWLRRVNHEGTTMLQIGTLFLRSQGLPVNFEELPEIPNAPRGTGKVAKVTTSPTGKEAATEATSAGMSNDESSTAKADELTTVSGASDQLAPAEATLRRIQELKLRRAELENEIARTDEEVVRLLSSLSREDLINLALSRL